MENIKLKNISRTLFIVLSLLLIVGACTDDEQGTDTVTPVFPKAVELTCTNPGDVAVLTFDANTTWNLSASRIWCKFIYDGDTVSSVRGEAGRYEVKVLLTDDAWTFEDIQAGITMGMSGESKVIATLTRAALQYNMEIYGKDFIDTLSAMNPVILKWNDLGTTFERPELNIKGNFSWQLVEYPEWVNFSKEDAVTGTVGELVNNTLLFNREPAFLRYSQRADLVFGDTEGHERFRLPVHYPGMPMGKVEFVLPGGPKFNFVCDAEVSMWGVRTADGLIQKEFPVPLTYEIVANPAEKLHFCYLKAEAISQYQSNLYLLDESERWYSTEYVDESQQWTVAIKPEVNESGQDRESQIYMIPDSIFVHELEGDFANLLELKYGRSRVKTPFLKYSVIGFLQKKKLEPVGFDVVIDNQYYASTLVADADESVYGTTDVFEYTLPSPTPDELILHIKGYPGGSPDITTVLNATNTLWTGVEVSFVYQSEDLSLRNVSASAKDTPMVVTYKYGGEPFAVLIIKKGE